ncbi:MAG: monovalent cation/H(+) antiporter subunit G [Deltaproteobacteria bacterium]|nr:monovalent cation/H(+) antiporter subunit G [Deltaproteobacteria bacterium]
MNIIVTIFLISGLIIFTGGAVGIIRFPDFYSRLHPAGKLDTMGLFMSMLAIALYTLHDFSINSILTSLKIFLIVVFVFITSPSSANTRPCGPTSSTACRRRRSPSASAIRPVVFASSAISSGMTPSARNATSATCATARSRLRLEIGCVSWSWPCVSATSPSMTFNRSCAPRTMT